MLLLTVEYDPPRLEIELNASPAARASSVAKVIRRGRTGTVPVIDAADDTSAPVEPTSMSTVAISHHCVYSFSRSTNNFMSSLVPVATTFSDTVSCTLTNVLRAG
jgi:hypothetical protein